MAEILVEAYSLEGISNLFGNFDFNIRLIEKEYNVKITNRDTLIKIEGDNAEKAKKLIMELLILASKKEVIDEQKIRSMIDAIESNTEDYIRNLSDDCICHTASGTPIKPKTIGQKNYVEAIKNNIITVGVGPAGTGKTYLAVAMAVVAFKKKEINRIILTRPAVEAGESLGFLPGDLQEKVDPYLRPLYDALFEMLGGENFTLYQEKGMIEVAPLAYMRGRTLDNSFIILDEAQNTTKEQMKMFLTRIGFNSKAVITGDITQIDLPHGKVSGLKDAIRIIKNIEDIEVFNLTDRDVVRHPLIQKIIKAYERADSKK
ncbi:MAG: PhoH family protein [Clostridia bacterium]|nr:phosphate starvation-inducible protein PhoH [Oscillospiraceae bacterium]MBR4893549.1 PhoH family protein [Clostridia bacterium]